MAPVEVPPDTEAVRWLTTAEQKVWRRLVAVESRLRNRLDQDLRRLYGISEGDYAVLVNLSEAPDSSLRMSDLASRLLLSRSGLTRRVDTMERKGLVIRRSCPADGRGAMAELTAEGTDLLRRAAPVHVAGVRRYLIDALGDLEGLSAGLGRVERALDDKERESGCPAPDSGSAAARRSPAASGAGPESN